MKQILYIGNFLNSGNNLPTGVHTLSEVLGGIHFNVDVASQKKNKILRLLDMLWHVLRAKKSGFVLIDTYSTSNFWYAFFVAQLCRVRSLRYLPILHGGNLPIRLRNSPWASRAIFAHAHVNVAPSFYLKNAFETAGYKNLALIPNSLNIEEYPFKPRRNIQPKLFWVRAFSEIYHPILALKVLEVLLPFYPGAKLCMVGPRKDASLEKCQNYAQKKQLPVTFTGKLSKEAWRQLAVEYDIFLNTTNIDNTPISVMEVMALGLPIVSTNVGGLPYLITHKKEGLLAEPNNPENMAKLAQKLIEDPENSYKMTLNARKKVEKLDWNSVKNEWIQLLNEQ